MRKNRVPWIVGGVIILLLVIGSFVCGKKEKKAAPKPPPENARALSVPANRARTVVVAPCDTPVVETARAVRDGDPVPGATTLELPRGQGLRYVLIPHCTPGAGVATAIGNIPSAALVLAGGQKPTEGEGGGFTVTSFTARTQLIVPNGSATDTIVVPPCEKTTGERDVVLGGESGGATAVAPAC